MSLKSHLGLQAESEEVEENIIIFYLKGLGNIILQNVYYYRPCRRKLKKKNDNCMKKLME